MAEFVLQLNDIDETGNDYDFPVETSWLVNALAGCDVNANTEAAPGAVHVRAQKTGNDVLVTGTVSASLKTECYRCLGDAILDIDTQVATLFSPKVASRASDKNDDEDQEVDELDRDTFTGDRVELDDLVREALLLEVPMQSLCREDCAGIPLPEKVKPPADFGRDAVDPRLAPLMNVSLKQKSQKE